MNWLKISSSINYFINKEVIGDNLIESNEKLLDRYIYLALYVDDGGYYYIDKKTYKFVKFSDEEFLRVKKTFLERLEKKKMKYNYEVDMIRAMKLIKENEINLENIYKEKKYGSGFKVIELKKKKIRDIK